MSGTLEESRAKVIKINENVDGPIKRAGRSVQLGQHFAYNPRQMTNTPPTLMSKSRERMPNNRFYASLRRPDNKRAVAEKVLCEVYLPDSHRGDIEVIFHPTAQQIPALQFVNPVSLYGRSREARFVIKSGEIWHEGATTGMQDGITFVYPCKGRATNIEIRNLLA